MLWLATAAAVLFAAFPYYYGAVAEWLLSNRKQIGLSNLERYNVKLIAMMVELGLAGGIVEKQFPNDCERGSWMVQPGFLDAALVLQRLKHGFRC